MFSQLSVFSVMAGTVFIITLIAGGYLAFRQVTGGAIITSFAHVSEDVRFHFSLKNVFFSSLTLVDAKSQSARPY